nr:hypothetical protein [Rhodococcus sp. 4CII]
MHVDPERPAPHARQRPFGQRERRRLVAADRGTARSVHPSSVHGRLASGVHGRPASVSQGSRPALPTRPRRPLAVIFPAKLVEIGARLCVSDLTWHNDLHDRTRSATRGASSRRSQACLQLLLSALSCAVIQPVSPFIILLDFRPDSNAPSEDQPSSSA